MASVGMLLICCLIATFSTQKYKILNFYVDIADKTYCTSGSIYLQSSICSP